MLKDLFFYKPQKSRKFTIGESKANGFIDTTQRLNVSKDIQKNRDYLYKLYNMPLNGDIVFRDFTLEVNGKTKKALLVSTDGLSSRDSIDHFILKPLLKLKDKKCDYSADGIIKELIPHIQIAKNDNLNELAELVNFGNAIIFFDGIAEGISADVKMWEHKGVDTPQNEAVIQGPNESFNSVLRTNTALIRKSLNNHFVTCENFTCGRTSKTPGAIIYMSNVVNTTLLNEVRFRLGNIDAEYVLSVLDIEKYIEDGTYIPIPQMLTTERPDRVAGAIANGKIAIALNGSSNVLVLPVTISDLTKSSEDEYLRYPYSAFISFLRIFAVIISLIAPALFVAMCLYHRELIVTPLMLAIQSSRLSVPFGIIGELIVMELCFELIKEAGVRIPGPIGSTVGIVGGLILGQSAVEANIVSPIMIIVVAVCGLAGFAIPSYPFSFSTRFLRFFYTAASAFFGIAGILILGFINVLIYANTRSFGVDITYPSSGGFVLALKTLFTKPIWRQNYRPDEAKPVDKADKGFISRKWKY